MMNEIIQLQDLKEFQYAELINLRIVYVKNNEEQALTKANISMNPAQLKKDMENINNINLKLESDLKVKQMTILELNDQLIAQSQKLDDNKRLEEKQHKQIFKIKNELKSKNYQVERMQIKELEVNHIKDRLESILKDIDI